MSGDRDELITKIESQRRWIASLEARLTAERERGAVQRVIGVGSTLATVALFLPWRHPDESGPNDWTVWLGVGAGATVVALLVGVGVFTASSAADTAPLILATAAIALGLLIVGVFAALSSDRHAPLGPGPILAAIGCATLFTGGLFARENDRRPNR